MKVSKAAKIWIDYHKTPQKKYSLILWIRVNSQYLRMDHNSGQLEYIMVIQWSTLHALQSTSKKIMLYLWRTE